MQIFVIFHDFPQTSVGPNVALEVEGVVEALAAVGTLVLLEGGVVAPMSVQHPNVFKTFAAHFALVRVFFRNIFLVLKILCQ